MTQFLAIWDGGAIVPLPRFKAALGNLAPGEVYAVKVTARRSDKERRFYHACLTAAWENLPEDIAARFPTVEHLRSYALIKCGYCSSRVAPASSPREAMRWVSFIQPSSGMEIVTRDGSCVTIYSALSQSAAKMGVEQFRSSKTDVLALVASMCGLTVDELTRENKDV